MYRVLKYVFMANTYKRAKSSFITLFLSFMGLVLSVWIISDFMSVSSGVMVYVLLLLKWVMILSLISLMGYSILKIINVASNPFATKDKPVVVQDVYKKEYILNKAVLRSKSDLIVEKYLKDLK
ncbi:hypothetical protein JHD49_09280 [Sulfurimonas sp. SAG-AH-194-C21]|nr:hypothetical protein [Sulfurimonas sp. SAG-AH-194-C21]MDF1884130.1 hypothetical protein [Sulfurimonas sp. SAG-AH-194-C21]